MILQGVARQVLQKAGVRLWWVSIPQSLPTPSVFVGVDVFHAPRVYDPKAKKRVAKASCAAIIVQVVRSDNPNTNRRIELYTQAFAREPGKEFDLGDAIKETLSAGLQALNVHNSVASCIVWRDGISDSAFGANATEEIAAIRQGLVAAKGGAAVGVGGSAVVGAQAPVAAAAPQRTVPLAYVVCQKRIDKKFLSKATTTGPGGNNNFDGMYGAPSGTLVQGIQGLDPSLDIFYINGRCPPYSTPKPVRFVIAQRDPGLVHVPIPELTWSLCHDYPNWVRKINKQIYIYIHILC